MELTGRIEAIFETQQISENFKKREFVLTYAENPQYPESIKLELTQDKCEVLDGFQVGQAVFVSFNLRGRKYEHPEKGTMYFNTLQAWSIVDKSEEGDGLPF